MTDEIYEVSYIDHVDEGLGRVVDYYADKENFLKLIEIFLLEIQRIEDAFLGIGEVKDLSTITGIWLDYFGKTMGELRGEDDDDLYRTRLYLRVAINTANGTTPSVRDIFTSYTDSSDIRIAEGILSYGQLIFNGTSNACGSLIYLMDKIKPITTNCRVIQNTESSCIFPAWEEGVFTSEELQIFDGTDTHVVDVQPSETSSSVPLHLLATGVSTHYDNETTYNPILAWEEPDGSTYGGSPLPWDITDESFFVEGDFITPLIDAYGSESNLLELLASLAPIYQALPTEE